jgi:hypothetical protein
MRLISISWDMLSNRTTGEHPRALIQLPIYDQEIGVWCAINANRIIELIFYEKPFIFFISFLFSIYIHTG